MSNEVVNPHGVRRARRPDPHARHDCNLPRPREHLRDRWRAGAGAPWRQDLETLDLVDTVYLMSLLGDHPRAIDRYIDYFGGSTSDLEPRDEDQEI